MSDRRLNTILIYGHAGYGKTSCTAMAMPNALWVVTRKRNLDAYRDFLVKEPEKAAKLGLKPVKHIIEVPTKAVNPETKRLEPVSTISTLDAIIESYTAKVINGEAQFEGIVFDEFSVFAQRVYDEMRATNRNGFEVIGQFKTWIADMLEIAPIVDKPMALICHAKDPTYYDEGPKAGQVKYKGGPAMPIGTVIGSICTLPDAVFQLEALQEDVLNPDKVRRVFKTSAHPLWERKCRLWGIDSVIDADLRKLLYGDAGWEVPAPLPAAR